MKNYLFKVLLFLLYSFILDSLQAQNLWANVYPQAISPSNPAGNNTPYGINVLQTVDGGFICTAQVFSNPDSAYLFKVDSLGNFLWKKYLNDFLPTSWQAFGHTMVESNSGKIFISGRNTSNVAQVRSFDASGNLLWTHSYPPSFGSISSIPTMIQSNDGMLTGILSELSSPHLIKIDTTNGNIIWDLTNLFQLNINYTLSILQDNLGNYYIPGGNDGGPLGSGTEYRILWKISSSGQFLDSVAIGGLYPDIDGIIQTQDGNFVIASTDNNSIAADIEFIKVSPQGTTIWTQYIPYSTGGHIYGLNELMSTDIVYCGYYGIHCLTSNGILKWNKQIIDNINPTGGYSQGIDLIVLNDNDYVCTGSYLGSGAQGTYGYPFITRTDSSQATHFEQVTITSYPDYNLNCTQDMNEYYTLNNLLYQITDNSTNLPYYGFSGGLYNNANVYLPSGGSYSISLCPQDTNEWVIGCGINTFQVNTGVNTYLTVPLQAKYLCPRSTIEVSAPFLQPGFNSNVYVYYCNQGTISVPNTQVVIQLDSFLTYNNATISPSAINGQTLTFSTGNLAVGECKSFSINCHVSQTAPTGTWHCNTAHISPDTLCGIYWTGAVLNLDGYCQNDTFHYMISNTGSNMTSSAVASFYANNTLVKTDNFQLLQGQMLHLTIPNIYNAGFYRMEIPQASGFPALLGDSIAAKNLMPCNGTSSNNWGAWSWYNDYSGQTSTDISYSPNASSFDPNDKTAIPSGIGNQHITAKNGKMEYMIRFQNTGTAAARNVILLDTLDTNLALNSIEILNASHPFVMDILAERVLRFAFLDIMLPHSSANEPQSHGFIKYQIHQNPNLVNGTELHNQAGIYFDFNAPVYTNDAWHTIGNPFIVDIHSPMIALNNVLQLMPNPINESAEIRWEGRDDQSEYNLIVQDMTGRSLREEKLSFPFMIHKKDLATGVYVVAVQDKKGNHIGNLRMMVK